VASRPLQLAATLGQKLQRGRLANGFRVGDVYLQGWPGLDTPNDFLSPRSLTAALSDGARVVRHQSPDTSGYHEHKPFAITVRSSHVVKQERFAYLTNTLIDAALGTGRVN